MSSEKVWCRFDGKRKDGTVLKLRIQDLPPARRDDALDVFVTFFVKDETLNKAVGISNNERTFKNLYKFYKPYMYDPSYRAVICCLDEMDDVKDIMAVSVIKSSTDVTSWVEDLLKNVSSTTPEEENKVIRITHEYITAYDPVKEFNLDAFYEDKGVVVAPDYRGLGIAENFFKVRRLMCEAHGVPMTGAWMTGIGTQIAAARDGWKTVYEIGYNYLGKKYDVTFTDGPPSIKFMIAQNVSSTTPEEENKVIRITHEYITAYDPVKEFNLDAFYEDKGVVVAPDYRGLGIAENFFKVRRLMCEAHGVPMTGAWMTGIGTQIAAARDGWKTVYEIGYDYLGKKYDVTFTDGPPSIKFMIAQVGTP